MKRKIISVLLVTVLLFVGMWLLATVINLALGRIEFTAEAFFLTMLARDVLLVAFGLTVLIGVGIIIFIKPRLRQSVVKTNVDLEDSHFMSTSEIRKSKSLRVVKYENLHKTTAGIPLAVGKKVVLADPMHTLAIGTNGSGKTKACLSPTIQVLGRTKTKPSMIISDPKGELFETHSKFLKEQGYDIQHIDLGDGIFKSSRWNPFDPVFDKIQKIVDLKDSGTAESAIEIKNLRSEVYQDMQDIMFTSFPIAETGDKFWSEGARDFIFAVALAFCEDVELGIMDREQFNFFNLHQIITNNTANECEGLKEFFTGRAVTSKAVAMSKQVLDTGDKQLSSYITTVHNFLNDFNDIGITTLTSSSDIKFDTFDDKPSVLFIRIPDERQTRHKLATLMIQTAYKQLVAKARENLRLNKTPEERLQREVFFLLEEFGNLPKMQMIDKIITVGRSRKIFVFLVIQDYAQLPNIYGKQTAEIIKSNCNIKMFIGSTDKGTIEEISQLCGKKKVAVSGYSSNHKEEESTSVQAKEVPIIYPSELETLNSKGNYGNCVVLHIGLYPLKTKFLPTFMDKKKRYYSLESLGDGAGNKTLWNEEDVIYSVAYRNKLIDFEKSIDSKIEKATNNLDDIFDSLKGYITEQQLAELKTAEFPLDYLHQLLEENKNTVTKLRLREIIDLINKGGYEWKEEKQNMA